MVEYAILLCEVVSFFTVVVHTINVSEDMHSNIIFCYYLMVLLELADFYVVSIKKNDMPVDIPIKNCSLGLIIEIVTTSIHHTLMLHYTCYCMTVADTRFTVV